MNSEHIPNHIYHHGLVKVLVVLVLAMLAIFLGTRTLREIRESRSFVPQRTISVSGEGSVFARPDIGEVTISIFREAQTAATAQEEAAEATNAVVDFLKGNNVEEKDIQTINFFVQPVYDWTETRGRVLRGWEVRQSLRVKIRNLDASGAILSGATQNGANDISGLSFTIDEPGALQAEAREEAIQDAREKAEKLAEDLGTRLGRVVGFSEGGGPTPVFFREDAAMGLGSATANGGIAPSVPVGENEITSNVTIVYEIK